MNNVDHLLCKWAFFAHAKFQRKAWKLLSFGIARSIWLLEWHNF